MKVQAKSIITFLILLLVCSPTLAEVPDDLKVPDVDKHLCKLGVSDVPSLVTVSKSYTPSIGSSRIGLVTGNVAEYKIKIKVGSGEYDYITLTNYVQEEKPWHTNISKNLVILPGQGLTVKFYSDMAIYYAQQGYSTYVLDRRETNIPSNETDFSFMEHWTIDKYLEDTYNGIKASRLHTAFLSDEQPAKAINVTAIGHSHGALLLTAYEASQYDYSSMGSVDKVVPIDIIIKYDPEELGFINEQAQEFNDISESIENGTYNCSSMGTMMGIANLAYTYPEETSPFQPGLTNMQLFRLMASQTYLFSKHPYTPDYHYWSGAPDLSDLYYVDENRLLTVTLTGGAIPYTPKYTDQYMAGLMGNIDGYEINSSEVDSPLLYVGLGGGFGNYGSWWYENEVGKTNDRVTAITWNAQGHGSIALDYNSQDLWVLIDNWIKNN